jgi:hypothetical protein
MPRSGSVVAARMRAVWATIVWATIVRANVVRQTPSCHAFLMGAELV